MKTYLITGGTDGMGKETALLLLNAGNRVIVVGSSAQKGESFLADTERLEAKQRAVFMQADLSLLEENRRIINEVNSRFSVLDGIIFCAVNFKQRKEPYLTKEGFESIFSLVYLSRFVLSYGLTATLEKSANPIIVNFCAPGVYRQIMWDDIQFRDRFVCINAMIHAGYLNIPLGIGYVQNKPFEKVKYILFNPGIVKTNGIMEEFGPLLKFVYKVIGNSAKKAVEPIIRIIKNPPKDNLSAFAMKKPVRLNKKSFDDVSKLYTITTQLIDNLNQTYSKI
jgi:short-subunit dehydrogenase